MANKKRKGYAAEAIRWVDSYHVEGWQFKRNVKASKSTRPGVIQSAGFVVEESKEFVVLSTSIGCDCVHTPLHIPKRCIVKRRPLRV